MTSPPRTTPSRLASDPVIDWLLDADPAVRWQVLRDLAGAPGDVVAAERA
ncbi:MAG: squalene cyclase, partial [Vicinamibacterales bacterium]